MSGANEWDDDERAAAEEAVADLRRERAQREADQKRRDQIKAAARPAMDAFFAMSERDRLVLQALLERLHWGVNEFRDGLDVEETKARWLASFIDGNTWTAYRRLADQGLLMGSST